MEISLAMMPEFVQLHRVELEVGALPFQEPLAQLEDGPTPDHIRREWVNEELPARVALLEPCDRDALRAPDQLELLHHGVQGVGLGLAPALTVSRERLAQQESRGKPNQKVRHEPFIHQRETYFQDTVE